MIKILLIDDNRGYADSLYDSAYSKGFELTHTLGLEEGLAEIQSDPSLCDGLIIDGRGWLSEDAPTETDSHVHTAIRELLILKERGFYIPYVINTGYFERLSDQIANIPSEIIFDKTKGAEPMFLKLKELIDASPIQRLKTKYPEAFASVGGKYLPSSAIGKLIDLLSWLEGGSFNQNYFNTIRDVLEEMLKRASSIDSNVFLPTALIRPAQDGRPNLKACEMYLTGRQVDLGKMGGTGSFQAPRPIFTPHIGWLFSSTSTNSQILSHASSHKVTPYAFKASVFSLIEILIWFKDYVDTNYPE